MKKTNTKKLAWLNLLFFLITLGINALGSMGFFNGMSQKAISDKYHTLITPAPLTFSIWGLIYVLVFISLIFMIVKERDFKVKKLITIFTPAFILSSIFNSAWIILFSYEKIGISTIFIFGLLLTLTSINKKLLVNKSEVPFGLPALAFGLYAGWLTIATVVNISAFLVSIKWDGFGIAPTIWAPLTLVISLLIVVFITSQLKNASYPLPIAWAFYGIYLEMNRLGESVSYGPFMKPVLIIGIIALLVISILHFKKNEMSII